MTTRSILILALVAALAPGALVGQIDGTKSDNAANEIIDPGFFSGMEYRLIGPFRGGRSTAVTGIPGEPLTFFHGTTGGGVWKTTDAGESWENISDGFFDVSSIGAVEVAASDPNVIYVGTGSAGIRGNVQTGRGVYRSTDGGDNWEFKGLSDAGLIGRMRVHSSDPDLVYAAALGHPFGKNEERPGMGGKAGRRSSSSTTAWEPWTWP